MTPPALHVIQSACKTARFWLAMQMRQPFANLVQMTNPVRIRVDCLLRRLTCFHSDCVDV